MESNLLRQLEYTSWGFGGYTAYQSSSEEAQCQADFYSRFRATHHTFRAFWCKQPQLNLQSLCRNHLPHARLQQPSCVGLIFTCCKKVEFTHPSASREVAVEKRPSVAFFAFLLRRKSCPVLIKLTTSQHPRCGWLYLTESPSFLSPQETRTGPVMVWPAENNLGGSCIRWICEYSEIQLPCAVSTSIYLQT